MSNFKLEIKRINGDPWFYAKEVSELLKYDFPLLYISNHEYLNLHEDTRDSEAGRLISRRALEVMARNEISRASDWVLLRLLPEAVPIVPDEDAEVLDRLSRLEKIVFNL